ncbi:fibronectin type III domain-containing protein [Modestobacter sp. Leaf380]|uniref:fibronectin type III domain-containing protein n=1 Tax=Modestobacter sp. Leaf380 TaxID=1736356 RepID=UPI0007017604|nr:fibronectin type III domain-containing protein [Modestobacter sp. Leaf380]KQS71205.1 hypothetical protein ASG41_20955 [Modestobacter sp. Leaf380]
MRFTSPSRRALGLLAASTIAMSTAVLGVSGVASAEPDTTVTSPASEPTAADEETESPVEAALPSALYLNPIAARDSALELNFVDQNTGADVSTGYQVSLNNNDWVALAGTTVRNGRTFATVNGLVNGTSYSVKVRAVNATGYGPESNAETGTPVAALAAPTNVVATAGPGSLRVTWDAPAGSTGWIVSALPGADPQSSQGLVLCEATGTERACTLAVPAGTEYSVGVRGSDANGTGQAAFVLSPVVPALTTPSAVPTKDDGDIKGPAGPITAVGAGQSLVLTGDGFLAGSTVKLTVFSTPVDLGSVLVASDGTFSATVTVPTSLTNGTHSLVATGVAADGSTRNLVITVTVSGGVAVVSGPQLANTGFDTAVPLTGGALALLAGAGLLVGARRRSN